ncbi:MAG: hypothetical protein IPK82_43245 [Polyangiaceae bacterium]|nr:hypothetical protein [Polyangiaceae bacterium]
MITPRIIVPAVVITSACVVTLVAGCDNKPAETPPQPMPTASAPAPMPTPTATAPAPQVMDCDAVQAPALTSMLQARSATEAPGMQPDGAAICKVVPDGQTAMSQPFIMQQGFCYTILGSSLPPVTELDMELTLDLSAGGTVPPAIAGIKPQLLIDTEAGPNAALASKNQCYKWAFPIPAAVRVTLKPRTGSGPVAAQIFKKKSF